MMKDKPISHLKLIFIFLKYRWQNKKMEAMNKLIKIIVKKFLKDSRYNESGINETNKNQLILNN